MAWYPGAKKMELQPESDSQQAIRPTQFIMHSIAAPWDEQRIYEYWRDSTNLESHFGLDYDGSIGQFIGTQTRADACYLANRRADGTGAVSIETASNLKHTDPWTPQQIEQLILLGVWLHKQHDIPLRICRSWTDPGFGYHRLWSQWSDGGTDCPGDARVAQFKNAVFPGIVARATGQTTPEEDMALTDAELKQIGSAVWNHTEPNPVSGGTPVRMGAVQRYMDHVHGKQTAAIEAVPAAALTPADITAIATQVAGSSALAEAVAEKVAAKLADRLAE